MGTSPSFEDVCKYVGQLFLDQQHQLELLKRDFLALRVDYEKAIQERDQTLSLLTARKDT